MIRFGPAGIPLSCKGRTLADGIKDVHTLGLTAMEIQMIRPETTDICPEDEDVDCTIREIQDRFIVGIRRGKKVITNPDEVITKKDNLIMLNYGVSDCFGDLKKLGDYAKKLDVQLSVHTPFYMDFASNNEITESCINSIKQAATVLNELDGTTVVANLGVIPEDIDDAEENIRNNLDELLTWWAKEKIKPKLGIEITCSDDVWGSLENVVDLCDEIKKNITPVINWANYYIRSNGALYEMEDFDYIFDEIAPYTKGGIYSTFSGVEQFTGEKYRYTPIKKGDLKFETLAECISERRPDMTVISASPLLEHDAVYMRVINDRMFEKVLLRLHKQAAAAAKKKATAED